MAKSKHHGFALPAVMGILALTSLACAVVWRMQWVHQQLLQAQTRLMRNQHIADGVLPLVVQDILGTGASSPSPDVAGNMRHFAGTDAQSHVFYPNSALERDKLQLRLGASMCQAGICAPKTLANLSANQWRNLLDQSQAVSMANLPTGAVAVHYWVEVWLNANAPEIASSASSPLTPSPFLYRITVLVKESASTSPTTSLGPSGPSVPLVTSSSLAPSPPSLPQPNSLVLQAIWSRATPSAPSGQWHSWKLLA